MADIIEFRKPAVSFETNEPIVSSEDVLKIHIKRNWHILAIELYANGFTANFFERMNRPARRELLIKSLPANERYFYLELFGQHKRLLGKTSSYGFKSRNQEGFTEWEINSLVEKVTANCRYWARAVLINLKNLERQQGLVPSDLRKELIADAFKREIPIIFTEQVAQPLFPTADIPQLDLLDAVENFLKRSSDQDRVIIRTLYNIDGQMHLGPGKRLTYQAVSRLSNYSPRQVSHSHKKCKRRVRHPSHKRYLAPVASLVNPAFIRSGAELFICDMFDLR